MFSTIKVMRSEIVRKTVLATILVSIVVASFAQQATPAAASQTGTSSTGMLWYLLIATMAILLFAVIILGNVLVNLAKLSVEKSKKAKSALLILFLIGSSVAFGQDATIAKATSASPFNLNLIMAATVLLSELLAIVFLVYHIHNFLKELSDKKEEVKQPISFHMPKLFDKLNASVAIENEKDVLTDHDYDGIKELDNDLPPWWKYGFYLTIIWAVAYLFYYHVSGGPLSIEEYNNEMAAAKIEVAEYMKQNALNVDENTVTLGDASMVAEGNKLFAENCVACHGAKGEGNTIGPNLTDAYWIHGGSIQDVFKTIKYGWPAKGMRSWQESFSPIQIQQLASFVKSINGTNPENAKEPQGDLFQEGAVISADSTVVDSTQKAGM
jgi:cytochrome c oxidase cbb3-type subunit 3